MKIVIITDSNTKKLYGTKLARELKKYKPLLLSFKAGEPSKNYKTKQYLESHMLKQRCDRETIILALGGGVVGDISGYVAATYMRGISYIQIPTTLLAMVDSSIGGKTGINTPEGKNLIGAYHQPADIILNLNYLKTLPQRHLINGLIESAKMFMTNNSTLFHYFNTHIDSILDRDMTRLKKIITGAIKIKQEIVHKDEKDNNLRAICNFGHTIGHAIENIMGYKIMHGHAVGLGILVEAKIAELLGLLSSYEYKTIKNLLLKLNISSQSLKKLDINQIILATKIDKKVKSNKTRYVLLKKIGQVLCVDNTYAHIVSDSLVRKAFIKASEV